MKIEAHDINFCTKHEFSYEKQESFEEEFFSKSLETVPLEEKKVSPIETISIRKIKFKLIQEFLQMLSINNKTLNKKYTLVDLDDMELPQAIDIDKNKFFGRSAFRNVKRETVISESETLHVQTKGCITTSGGESIQINLNLNMQRSFYSKTYVEQSIFVDPLIVNLEGKLPELEDETFFFDIDCDGEKDQISCLTKHNGFLALDKNENGLIDDGSELFGTQAGNGFSELSAYDLDHNNWIDENDEIFEGLRIWANDEIVALGELGIGAIFLGEQNSPFTYKNGSNESLGQLRATSCFLYETGDVGTISQIDFAKQNTALKDALAIT